MIFKNANTNPVLAQHKGHHSFLQVLLLFRVECLSSCQSFSGVDPHASGKFGSHPSFFILPSVDLVHHRHCVGEHCSGLDIDMSGQSICCKGSVVHKGFTEFFQCVFLCTALLLGCLHVLPQAPSRLSPSCASCVSIHAQFWDIVIQQAF